MATSLALIVLLGILVSNLFERIKLPGLLGMLFLGMLLGPYMLNLIDSNLLDVSSDFRLIALLVILLRAGLGLSRKKLYSVGDIAIKLGFIPVLIEGFIVAYASTKLLGFTFIQGGILGFIIAAVSPAVVVPLMLKFEEIKLGTNKGIPTLILAGASIDDVFAITIFSTFLALYSGNHVNIGIQVMNIPISILLGIGAGVLLGILLVKLFNKFSIRDTKKVLILIGIAILLTELENLLKSRIEIAALLGVMTVGFIIFELKPEVANRLSIRFSKIWIFAEILLFVLVGAEVNINVAIDAGIVGIAIILLGLLGRSLGVLISTIGSELSIKERLFCAIAYTPKATVQAAISSIPLSLGVLSGDLILAIGVLSILFTAPLGSIAITKLAPKLLTTQVNT